MECKACGKRDFDVVKHSLLGYPYLECSHCRQGYIVTDKLNLKLAEIIGVLDTEIIHQLKCKSCECIRFIDGRTNNFKDTKDTCSKCSELVTEPAGEKISWDEFLNADVA